VVAADQVGPTAVDIPMWGHSMIVDPWGTVLVDAGDEPEKVIVADLDPTAVEQRRSELPALRNRRPGAYRWPDSDRA
jgi:predicted amidohydrolase